MGRTYLHHAIVVTSTDKEAIRSARAEAVYFGLVATDVVESDFNGFLSFVVVPDGSKENRSESDDADERREKFKTWMKSQRYETDNGPYEGSPLDWVEVSYGGDDFDSGYLAVDVVDHEWADLA
jgi:hypothetical protein